MVFGSLGVKRTVLVATSPLPESPILFMSTIVREVGIFDSNVNLVPLLDQFGLYSVVPSLHSSSMGCPCGPVWFEEDGEGVAAVAGAASIPVVMSGMKKRKRNVGLFTFTPVSPSSEDHRYEEQHYRACDCNTAYCICG